MPTSGDDRPRNVIPRWRTFESTMTTGELAPLARTAESRFNDSMVSASFSDWIATPGFAVAADLVANAFSLGRFGIADEAANFVLASSSDSISAKMLAKLYLEGAPPTVVASSLPVGASVDLSVEVRGYRAQLRRYPYNALLWANLARSYLIAGQPAKAMRAITVAIGLAPENRHILRAASRFFLHQGDPERAHALLLKAPQLKTDPWLLSAEIATAAADDKTSGLVKVAKRMLEARRFTELQTSELASAVGTVEANSGNRRLARQFLRASMINPTENACAQAAWVSVHVDGFAGTAEIPKKSPEANAWIAKDTGDWALSMAETTVWKNDQPFSSRPAILGSYLASTVDEKYDIAIEFAKEGLVSNPNDATLWNNLAFAFALKNNTDEARNALSQIDQSTLNETGKVMILATQGLIAFRAGDPGTGRTNYRDAITLARRHALSQEFDATIHLILEEVRLGEKEVEPLRSMALDVIKKISGPLGKVYEDKLKNARSSQTT